MQYFTKALTVICVPTGNLSNGHGQLAGLSCSFKIHGGNEIISLLASKTDNTCDILSRNPCNKTRYTLVR